MRNREIQQKIYFIKTSDISDRYFKHLMSPQVFDTATKAIKFLGRDALAMPILFPIMNIVVDYVFKDQE